MAHRWDSWDSREEDGSREALEIWSRSWEGYLEEQGESQEVRAGPGSA